MEKALFDPGYSKHISSFVYFNEQANLMIKALKTPQQRSFKFRQLLPQILSVLKKEVGFYQGCLLWAFYIKNNFSSSPKEIEGNSFYGRSVEELNKYDYLAEVNYIIDFIEKYPKTLSYYGIKAEEIDKQYKKTAEIYKEFLILNESFINTKTTNDVKIPENFKISAAMDLLKIKAVIDSTVTDGNFERLFEIELL